MADRQAEPGAGAHRPGGEERIEDAREHLRRHSRAGVAHLDDYLAGGAGAHSDAHLVAVRIAFGDGLGRVQEQVDQHLPEVRLARLHRRGGLELANDPGAVAQVVGEQLQDLVGDARRVQRLAPLVEPAGEHLEPAHDLRHALGPAVRLGHRLEQVAGALRVGQQLGQLLLEQRQVRQHGGERVVDLVREAARQRPHRGHALRDDQVFLQARALLVVVPQEQERARAHYLCDRQAARLILGASGERLGCGREARHDAVAIDADHRVAQAFEKLGQRVFAHLSRRIRAGREATRAAVAQASPR